jgi:hypothetical protein
MKRSSRDRNADRPPRGETGDGEGSPAGPGVAQAHTAEADPQEPALRRLDRLAWALDALLPLPFTRFRIGIDGLVGLIPVVGDLVSAGLSLYLIAEAWRFRLSRGTILRMLANVVIDGAIGLVPVVGDLFDFGFKANRRNVELVRRRLRERGQAEPEAGRRRGHGAT